MRIDTTNLNTEMKKLYNLIFNSGQTSKDTENQLPVRISRIILLLQNNFPENLQKILLQTWLAMEIPLQEEHLSKLEGFINNSSLDQNNQVSLIKSFAILLKEQLPLLTQLIKGVSQNLNPDESLSRAISDLTDGKTIVNNRSKTAEVEKTTSEQISTENMKNKLTVSLEKPVADIAEKLADYPQIIRNFLQTNSYGENSQLDKVINHLLGQQFLNHTQPNDRQENILLNLELPLIFEPEENPVPLYLQISENTENNERNQKYKKNYKLAFAVNLEKSGTIYAEILIIGKIISCNFQTSERSTTSLIEDYFPDLQERLKILGYTVKQPEITYRKEPDKLPELFFREENDGNKVEYTQIDFKV